jgi:heterodisulfide reductase subunit C
MKKIEIDFGFREKLNRVPGGKHHNYCYQCGACVPVCPSARYAPGFNPRVIVLAALVGMEDHLIRSDSPIWLCTNCYSCYERCPQDVRPIEVIIALKNMAVKEGKAPEEITKYSESIAKTGLSALLASSVNARRKQLGLDEFWSVPVGELSEILDDWE